MLLNNYAVRQDTPRLFLVDMLTRISPSLKPNSTKIFVAHQNLTSTPFKHPLRGLFFFLVIFNSVNLKAQLGENLFVGNTKAFGLANAVTADPPGIDSIHFNPAGLARIDKPGRFMETHLIGLAGASFVFDKTKVDNPYAGQNVFFNDCVNECLLGNEGVDPGSESDIEVEAIQIYFPGYGIIEEDAGGGKSYTALPRAAFAYHPKGKNWTFGTSFYINLTLGFKLKEHNDGRFGGINNLALGSFNLFAPTLAWKFNDSWSFGVSMGVQTMGLATALNLRLPTPLVGGFNEFLKFNCNDSINFPLCDSDNPLPPLETLAKIDMEAEDTYTPSLTLGVLWEPNHWFTWGAVYRSSVKHRMKGLVNVEYNEALASLFQSNLLQVLPGSARSLPAGNSVETIKINIPFTMPQHLATGISLRLTPKFKFNMDYKWTEYSKWDTWNIHFENRSQISAALWILNDGNTGSFALPMGLVDKGNSAFGMEYQWSDKLLLRAGYEYRPSVVPKDKQTILIPIADMTLKNIGIKYQWSSDAHAELSMGLIETSQSLDWDPSDPLILYPGHAMEVGLRIPIIMFTWQRGI